MKRARLSVLVENTAGVRGTLAEHGLAFWLETDSISLLFDTGQSGIVSSNARALRLDLYSADALMLSHGHYDHTGGLAAALREFGANLKAFVHPAALLPKYVKTEGGACYIGISPENRAALERGAELISTVSPTEIGAGIYATGSVPRIADFERFGGRFFEDEACSRPDEILDDQALFLDGPNGVVVLLGCAHAGIINTLNYIKQLLPSRPIHTVIGGTHLVGADRNRLLKTADALRGFGLKRLMPLHCTGFEAAAFLYNELPGLVFGCPTGAVLDLFE